jgi:hypothetical protein
MTGAALLLEDVLENLKMKITSISSTVRRSRRSMQQQKGCQEEQLRIVLGEIGYPAFWHCVD